MNCTLVTSSLESKGLAFVAADHLLFRQFLPSQIGCRRSSLSLTRRPRFSIPRVRATPVATSGNVAASSHRCAETAGLSTLLSDARRRYVFFGGKGGVGKTSLSAATAVKMADEGMKTLIISTDPAHSLGDALRLDLSDGKLRKVAPELDLYAIESDTSDAVAEFRKLVAGLRDPGSSKEAQEAQEEGWKGVAKKLGLEEFSDVLDTVPPGADELIALVRVLNIVENQTEGIDFQRVVVDCAPTGHTLRFLAFPDFLDKFLTKALALRKKLDLASSMLGNVTKMFVKNPNKVDVSTALETASTRVERYRDRMNDLSELFRDPARAEFVVVSIPTVMAIEESKRLIEKLWDDGIWVRHVIVNQVLQSQDKAQQSAYLERLRKGQARELAFATEELADEYGLSVTPVFRFDAEIRGIYALRALAMTAFTERHTKTYHGLFDDSRAAPSQDSLEGSSTQFVFAGGKGGVGKTSVSASMGVALADRGLKTLVISTDPAHSLGDSFNVSLHGGVPVSIEGTNGNLCGMEVDTVAAVGEFKRLVKDFATDKSTGVGSDVARKLGLGEFADILDNAPPGIDELVALTQVLDLVRNGKFDRVVIDTAPTGHCLRLLGFPEFLDTFLGKVIKLKQRLDSAIDSLRNVFGRKSAADAVDMASEKLEVFRQNMTMLRRLILDGDRTQFVVVTIPTGLAMAESERLIKALRRDGVVVRNLIVNQVIADSSASAFVERIVRGQDDCLADLRNACEDKNIHITSVPYFDVEVRGVPGLRALSAVAFENEQVESVV